MNIIKILREKISPGGVGPAGPPGPPGPPGAGGVQTVRYVGDGNSPRTIMTLASPPKVALFFNRGIALAFKKYDDEAGDLYDVFENGNPVNGLTFSGNDVVVSGGANNLGVEYSAIVWS